MNMTSIIHFNMGGFKWRLSETQLAGMIDEVKPGER